MQISVFFVSSLLLSLTSLFLIIIILRFGREKIHKVGTCFNFSIFIWGLGATLVSINPNNIYLADLAWKFGDFGVCFTSTLFLHFVYLLINIKPRIILKIAYIQSFTFSFLILTTKLIAKTPENLFHSNFYIAPIGPLFSLWFAFWFLILTYAHILLIKQILIKKEYRMFYYLIPISLAFLLGALNFLNPFGISIFQYGNFGIVAYCLSMTYFIFRNQIIGIEIVFKKGLFYSLLIAVLTALYLLLIILTEWTFRGWLGYKSIFISLSSAFIIAIIFNPLRDRLQVIVDHLFLRKTPQEISQENELLKQELERSERLKAAGTLALGLAHEIRNPLTTIKTFAEFLPEKYSDKDFISKFTKLIPTEVERINSIIHQLLTFSKPSPPSFKDTDIHGLIKDILGFLNSVFLKKKMRISEDYADSTLIIKIDPIQIKQALLNIILNAIDAMPNGGILSMKTEIIKDSCLKIRISDTGCGILKEDLKHIFDPFYSKKDEGTGLGLAITHRIITNHGGTIEAESETGKGAAFIITIPLTTKISEISEE